MTKKKKFNARPVISIHALEMDNDTKNWYCGLAVGLSIVDSHEGRSHAAEKIWTRLKWMTAADAVHIGIDHFDRVRMNRYRAEDRRNAKVSNR